jgi:cardiolipin synthase
VHPIARGVYRCKERSVKLIVQPEDGVKPLVNGIDFAKKTVEIAIFRFDRKEVEHAMENA